VVNDLATGNVLLTNEEKAWMDLSPCLGWDCSVRGDCPDPYICKNGGLGGGGNNLATYLGIFKCSVPVVAIVNSQTPGNVDIINIVANAAKNAAVTPPAGAPQTACPLQPSPQGPQVKLLPTPRPPTPVVLPVPTRVPSATAPAPEPSRTSVPRNRQPPRPPTLVAPIDGSAVTCGSVTLSWKPASDPAGIRSYDAELEKLVDRSYGSVRTWNGERGESVAIDTSCDARYRWRVRATDDAGNQDSWSGYGYFRTRPSPSATATPTPRDTQAPRPPLVLSPGDGITLACGPVNLSWQPASDPSGIRDYDVELEKLADRTYVAGKTWNNVRGDAVSFEPECGMHFRWRIRARDNAGNQGAWSEYQDFEVREMSQ
jgi:hypothetical protein